MTRWLLLFVLIPALKTVVFSRPRKSYSPRLTRSIFGNSTSDTIRSMSSVLPSSTPSDPQTLELLVISLSSGYSNAPESPATHGYSESFSIASHVSTTIESVSTTIESVHTGSSAFSLVSSSSAISHLPTHATYSQDLYTSLAATVSTILSEVSSPAPPNLQVAVAFTTPTLQTLELPTESRVLQLTSTTPRYPQTLNQTVTPKYPVVFPTTAYITSSTISTQKPPNLSSVAITNTQRPSTPPLESEPLHSRTIPNIQQRQSSLELESSRLTDPPFVTNSPNTSVSYRSSESNQPMVVMETHSSLSNDHTQNAISSFTQTHVPDISQDQRISSTLSAVSSSTFMNSQKFAISTTPKFPYSTELLTSPVAVTSSTRNPLKSPFTPGSPSFTSEPNTGETEEHPESSLTRESPQPSESPSKIHFPADLATTSSPTSYRPRVTSEMSSSFDIIRTQNQTLGIIDTRIPNIAGDLTSPWLCPISYQKRIRKNNSSKSWINWNCYPV